MNAMTRALPLRPVCFCSARCVLRMPFGLGVFLLYLLCVRACVLASSPPPPQVSVKVEDSSKPASPMPAPVTSCAVTSLPSLALSLKHEVASSASPTSAVSTGGAPHVHPSAASASTDLFIPLSSRTTAGRKHVKSESESVADKLCSLYKLPSVNIMSPNQLMPWMLEDGSKEKIAISSIFTCSKDKTATGVSRYGRPF